MTTDEKISSYAVHEVKKEAKDEMEHYGVCDSLELATDGFPVCGVVKFLAWIWNNMWDLSQNTPSS